jgi:transposase
MEISTSSIDHFGMIAGVFDELNISQIIDRALPKTRQHKASHSAIVKAMILNGLGFIESRLYFYSNFFIGLPKEKLLGEGITPSHLNDDTLSRTLDAIYEYCPTELFSEISLQALSKMTEETHLLHADTTNFSMFGKYEGDAPDGTDSIKITFGHAKDNRVDLKRFVLGMVVNQSGIPLFMQPFSGNKSDKKSLIEMIQRLRSSVSLKDSDYWVADSAVYTEENINLLGTDLHWISRIPETVGAAKELVSAELEMTSAIDVRYAYHATSINYGGIPQKAVVFWSKEMQTKQEETFDKNLQKKEAMARKDLNSLKRQRYACEPDAMSAAKKWISDHAIFLLKDLRIYTVLERDERKRGRPKKDEARILKYAIDADIEIDQASVSKERQKLGRFVLASNDLNLDSETMLKYYKGQQVVERGFRFLKNKSFHVSEVFLKKEERIEALAMIMVLCLLIYSYAEWKLRKKLNETGNSVPNQLKKPTQKPTMRWIFQLFMRVTLIIVDEGGRVISRQIKLSETQRLVLDLLGANCKKYYGLEC